MHLEYSWDRGDWTRLLLPAGCLLHLLKTQVDFLCNLVARQELVARTSKSWGQWVNLHGNRKARVCFSITSLWVHKCNTGIATVSITNLSGAVNTERMRYQMDAWYHRHLTCALPAYVSVWHCIRVSCCISVYHAVSVCIMLYQCV